MIVLYFFTKGERASSLNCKDQAKDTKISQQMSKNSEYKFRKITEGISAKKHINCHNDITCDMCSAAATLGLTTSQFAMTSVFGTLPSV